ncbi:MAG TPA: secretin N-terminal domain-containing protein [Verrucomicrobiales bacterium]|nr:secretin N-terminal domain-containing protein [Verrucomicrobiales bacterium]
MSLLPFLRRSGLLFLFLFPSLPLPAQEETVPADDDALDYEVQYPSTELRLVLNDYEEVTGTKLIKAQEILAVEVTIETSKKMTKTEWIDYVERSLLLNGVALVPAGPGTMKAVRFETKSVPNLGLDIYTRAEELPGGEQIVQYVMPLTYITTADARAVFDGIIPAAQAGANYAMVSEVPNANLLVITQNSEIIRRMIELKEFIDKPSAAVEQRVYALIRADVEAVASAIQEILQQQEQARSAARSQSGARTTQGQPAQARPPGVPQPGDGGAGDAAAAAAAAAGAPSGPPESQSVIVYPDVRTNRLFVIARPLDFFFIDKLIDELDAPADVKNFLNRPLIYVSVTNVIPVLADVLSRQEAQTTGGVGGIGGGAGGGAGGANTLSGSRRTGAAGGQFGGAQVGGRGGRGGAGGAQFGGGQFGGGQLGGGQFGGGQLGGGAATGSIFSEEDFGPESLVVGKTVLVGDSKLNNIIVSGPPESLRLVNELLDQLDVKPRQVYISTVIGQVTLGDDITFGFDLMHDVREFKVGGERVSAGGLFKAFSGSTLLDLDNLTLDQILGLGNGLNIYGEIGDYLNYYLKALESTEKFQVLSRPSIYVSNNRIGVIRSGLVFQTPGSSFTGGVTTGVTTNFRELRAELLLQVRPLINSDEEITLEISQLKQDIVGFDTFENIGDLPRIGEQELETEITVPNKSTVVLGGLISEEIRDDRFGLPFLVRIPLIKYLTGQTTKETTRQELLIFIQPQIIGGDRDLVDLNVQETQDSAMTRDILEFGTPSEEPFVIDPVGGESWLHDSPVTIEGEGRGRSRPGWGGLRRPERSGVKRK